MKCEFEKRKIHLFFDNRLEESEANILSLHIKECKDCNNELKYLELLNKQFAKMETVKISRELLSTLHRIGKRKNSLIEMLKDIYRITFKNKNAAFNIDYTLELSLKERYSEKILRWVFYC